MLPMIAGGTADYVTGLSAPVSFCAERPLVFSLEQHIDIFKRQVWA
jgi:hypothetical protein